MHKKSRKRNAEKHPPTTISTKSDTKLTYIKDNNLNTKKQDTTLHLPSKKRHLIKIQVNIYHNTEDSVLLERMQVQSLE